MIKDYPGWALDWKRPSFVQKLGIAAFISLMVAGFTSAQDSSCACGENLACYERGKFKVGNVRLETVFNKNVPLAFVFNIKHLLLDHFEQIKPRLALQEGQFFTAAAYTTSQVTLGTMLGELQEGERFKLVLISPSLRNCNAATPSVDVVYQVFTTSGLSFFTASAEHRNDRIRRNVIIPLPGTDQGKALPQPYVGYNRSRGIFGGSAVDLRTSGGIFDHLEMDMSGSGSSATVDAAIDGSKTWDESFLSYLQWKLAYSYSNIPANGIRLKPATVRAQLFAGSRPLGSRGLALRFGVSVEGGNRQTDVTAAPVVPLENTSYGAIKAYVGSTLNWGRQAFRASYGLQLGQATEDLRIDYLKHILDASYSLRLLPREHRPFRIDLDASGGVITSRRALVPIGERFFGGNARQSFIQESDWDFNSAPVIRSFPQNRFNLIGSGSSLGGTNFFSANLTLAQTIWYRSAVPEFLARDPELRIKLGGAVTTAREEAKTTYLYLAPTFNKMVTDVTEVRKELLALQSNLDSVKARPHPEVVERAIASFSDVEPESQFRPLPDSIDVVNTAIAEKKKTVDQVNQLVRDNDAFFFKSYLTVLTMTIEAAEGPFAAAGLPTSDLTKTRESLSTLQKRLSGEIDEVNAIGDYSEQDVLFVREKVNELTPILDQIQQRLSSLPAPADSDYGEKLAAAIRYRDAAQDGVNQVNDEDKTVRGAERLTVGYGKVAIPVLTGLTNSLEELQGVLSRKGLLPTGQSVVQEVSNINALQSEIRTRLGKVTVPDIEKKANRDVAFTSRVLDVIFRELNLIAASPLVMLDVARLGAPENDLHKVRYGVGVGTRFSLVSLDLDLGYSWNLNRAPGEGRGAFVFSMKVSDLFR